MSLLFAGGDYRELAVLYLEKGKDNSSSPIFVVVVFFFSKIAEGSADNRLRGENDTHSVGNIQVSQ